MLPAYASNFKIFISINAWRRQTMPHLQYLAAWQAWQAARYIEA